MVTLNKIYTKTGDKGLTSLGDGSRISKNDIRVEAYGTIDEANSIIGVVRSYTKTSELIILDNFLSSIQNELFDLGAELSTPSQDDNRKLSISQSQIDRLEQEIDQLNINLTALKSFVLPGGTAASSFLHLARTTIRRAERLMVELSAKEQNSVSKESLAYVNRLSDLCFVAARYANQTERGGQGDVLWKPGKTKMEQ
ncbi:MAG: cob(I)yrinic acid a,c-diamide adenosyltransferase [Rhizobiales bacterium TMED94]|nr:ATP:cob(I)alamin adenosyltransferase [Rhodobiaceae bacterium]RPF87653.1 MAG: cob(I)yrinic acid a,c-diamide adenosyltransferase [Rhizobiales bacterium TMED94]|tara:strand:- start:685 stop:1278 length:594 start_codon:yes stop_codon:yes gene_type:complete